VEEKGASEDNRSAGGRRRSALSSLLLTSEHTIESAAPPVACSMHETVFQFLNKGREHTWCAPFQCTAAHRTGYTDPMRSVHLNEQV
jgi:hypothetical protein